MKKYYLSILCLVFLFSCRDIIEPDISNKHIVLISPPDNFSTTVSTQTFWWEEIDGAEFYNLQIVSPTFNNVQQIIADTNINENKFSITLLPGVYQWRVRGLNNGGATDFTGRNLTIDSTSDLSTQTVLLNLPVLNYSTNQQTIFFEWSNIFSADSYRFKITNSQNISIIDSTLTETNINVFLAEGEYVWKVQALNSISSTPFSDRNLNIDLTSPNAPLDLLPSDNDTVFNPIVQLTWTTDVTSAFDSVFIYNDSLMTQQEYSGRVLSSTYTFNGQVLQHYYWRARSYDLAGNSSQYSILEHFYIDQ